jgi:hypothetical protein
MKTPILGTVALGIAAALTRSAQAPQPFKLGTFERGGQVCVGVVLRIRQPRSLKRRARMASASVPA